MRAPYMQKEEHEVHLLCESDILDHYQLAIVWLFRIRVAGGNSRWLNHVSIYRLNISFSEKFKQTQKYIQKNTIKT